MIAYSSVYNFSVFKVKPCYYTRFYLLLRQSYHSGSQASHWDPWTSSQHMGSWGRILTGLPGQPGLYHGIFLYNSSHSHKVSILAHLWKHFGFWVQSFHLTSQCIIFPPCQRHNGTRIWREIRNVWCVWSAPAWYISTGYHYVVACALHLLHCQMRAARWNGQGTLFWVSCS